MKARVQAGDNIWVSADVLMTHDVCGPGTIGVFKREFGKTAKVWDKWEAQPFGDFVKKDTERWREAVTATDGVALIDGPHRAGCAGRRRCRGGQPPG